MNQTMGVIRMHWRNKYWFIFPWVVLLISLVVNLFIGLLLGGNTTIYTGGVASIYVYMFIVGVYAVKDTFPFALGFSVRRTDYYLGTLLIAIAVSALTASLLLLLSLIEANLTNGWGVGVHFFHVPYVSDGPPPVEFWTYFATLIHLCFLGFLIGSIQQRLGTFGLLVFFAVIILALSSSALVCTRFNWWGTVFQWFGHHTAFQLAWWTVPVTVVCIIASYLLLRKASI